MLEVKRLRNGLERRNKRHKKIDRVGLTKFGYLKRKCITCIHFSMFDSAGKQCITSPKGGYIYCKHWQCVVSPNFARMCDNLSLIHI